ncbi:Hsp20/alpha crystallin family protein [Phycisphaera mikurensis]|uniref:Small heat shock protein n=1 Tax=Phycisphaera mikurensis (strain NBRC 102666 / KCTC 22515 / FYK2301M01) TaxID=1142394 RepID=I0IEP7_PHYMF|nr:Hsp20/alpha crystallin family protein [Phycisphaera mikurensis]MBB6441532.1 HSP20 family protein [Phycisphaera mikurensis]BAM03735.1 small heat shock protein [Phycisphaera mikurensis NBRC 102666]
MNTLPTLNNPFDMLRQFDRAVNGGASFFDGSGGSTPVGTGGFAVDVREEDDTLVVEAELPGFSKDQIDVNVENGLLTIEADRTERKQVGQDADGGEPQASKSPARKHIQERTMHVSRRFSLPKAYDATSVDASLDSGVLTLRLPKREDVKPRKIEVK